MKTKCVKWCSNPVNIPGIPFSEYEKETAFQVYCADWLRKRYLVTGQIGYSRWHHSANEREGLRAGFLAKMMGQSKGFPDFVHLGMRLAIELKVPGNGTSKEQDGWLDYLDGIGWVARVVWRFEDFEELVRFHVEQMPHVE